MSTADVKNIFKLRLESFSALMNVNSEIEQNTAKRSQVENEKLETESYLTQFKVTYVCRNSKTILPNMMSLIIQIYTYSVIHFDKDVLIEFLTRSSRNKTIFSKIVILTFRIRNYRAVTVSNSISIYLLFDLVLSNFIRTLRLIQRDFRQPLTNILFFQQKVTARTQATSFPDDF